MHTLYIQCNERKSLDHMLGWTVSPCTLFLRMQAPHRKFYSLRCVQHWVPIAQY